MRVVLRGYLLHFIAPHALFSVSASLPWVHSTIAGVTLVTSVVEIAPTYAEKFTRLVPALVKILRKLLMAGYAPEYDIGGVTDPFLQVRAASMCDACCVLYCIVFTL